MPKRSRRFAVFDAPEQGVRRHFCNSRSVNSPFEKTFVGGLADPALPMAAPAAGFRLFSSSAHLQRSCNPKTCRHSSCDEGARSRQVLPSCWRCQARSATIGNMRIALFLGVLTVLAGAVGSRAAVGQSDTNTIYVDPRITLVACPNYNPAGRACSNGRETAYKSLAAAAARAEAGTTVLIR